MKESRLWPALLALNLVACGGGGGGGAQPPAPPPPPPPPAALSGQFKLANTAGLAYGTPTHSGTTDARGTFRYAAGETVEFSVGGVVIGSAAGQAVLTPVDLIAGGNDDNPEVQNIARFLMMLDQNADPADGIEISANVQQAAQNWSQVDFSTNDLDNELVTIISDVASVDARPASLPGTAAARTLIVQGTHCAMSGFFEGTLTGERSDRIVVTVNPATGNITIYYTGAPTNFESTQAISVDHMRMFVATTTDGSDYDFEGRFDSYDEVSGVWTIDARTGQFTATRRLPDATSTYRFTGRFYRQTVGTRLTGPLVINVDEQGNVIVDSRDTVNNNDFRANGTYINGEFSYDYGDGQLHTGTTDENLYVAGSGTQVNGADRPWFAQGCRLN